MYNTIIVPTDFSNEEMTIKTLRLASELSDSGRIILLHVLDRIPEYALTEIPTNIMQELVPKTRDSLRELIFLAKVEAKTEVRNGSPYRKIIEAANEHVADLIIISSHQPGLQDYLLGSTAAKVVRHAPCSVFVDR